MGREDYKILILLLCSWFSGCIKDKPIAPLVTTSLNGNTYIICEGNFGNGNATLYAYNTSSDSVSGDLYKAVNNEQLGDVFQSMKRIGDSLYLCINNSDKIIVLNAITYKKAGTISIPKPRYIQTVTSEKAYVSSLYSNKVYSINPQTLQVTGIIELPFKNTEGQCLQSGSIFVCPWDTACNKVYKFDALTGKIIQSVQLNGFAPHAVLVDKEQMLWVLSGNKTLGKIASLSRIDPSTGTILKTYTFPNTVDPIKPVFNSTRDTLYFIEVQYANSTENNGIYRMAITDIDLPVIPFIKAAQYQYFWALGIEKSTGNIYVGDPMGFIQKGKVYVYKPDGQQVKTFDVGLGPGQFYFGD